MKLIYIVMCMLMFVSVNTASAMDWVSGNGSCKTTCESVGQSPIETGDFSNGHPFYVCSANENSNQGSRPGFNLYPSWQSGCTITVGTGPVSNVTPFKCLCD